MGLPVKKLCHRKKAGGMGRGMAAAEVLNVWLDVYKGVFYSQVAVQQAVFHLVGDGMALCDSQMGGNLDMQVYIIIESHFADETFFNLVYLGYICRQLAYFFYDLVGRRGVHDFVEGGTQQVDTIVNYDEGGDEGGPVVRGFISFSQQYGY